MTVVAALVLLPLGVAGLIGAAVSMVELARLGRELPNVPLHARLNPFNHAARPRTWTPAMRAANRRGVIGGAIFLGAVLLFSALMLLAGGG